MFPRIATTKDRGPSYRYLLAVRGCGVLSAAKILVETGRSSRSRSCAAYARFNGTALVLAWSSNTEHFRLNRGGDRQVNTALHMFAVTQLRGLGPGKASVERRLAAGDTKTEALRLLRWRISDAVFQAMRADETLRLHAADTFDG